MQTFLQRDGCALASFLMEIGVGQTLQSLLTISIVIFMVVSLLDLGLRLKLREALEGLRNVRFVMLSVLFGFIICPALAYLLATAIPLAPPYAMGMILLGMTPCSPFLPTMVDRARGDSAYAGAFTLLASVVTVAYMPLAVPVMVTGLTEDAWTIAKPLLFFVLAPTAIGMAIQRNSASLAAGLQPYVKKMTGISTISVLALTIALYGKGLAAAVGSYAFGTQILFFSVATAGTYALSFNLPQTQRSVLTLGMSTRNVGVAFAPLLSVQDIDQRAIVMVAIGLPMQIIASLLAAQWLARRAQKPTP